MKKFIITMLIIFILGVVLLLTGFGLFGFSISNVVDEFENTYNPDLTDFSISPFEFENASTNLAGINISLRSQKLVIRSGDEFSVVGAYDAERFSLNYYWNNGTFNLSIEQTFSNWLSWISFPFNWSVEQIVITLTIPTNADPDIVAKVSSGQIDLSNYQTSATINLSASSGTIKVADTTAQSLEVEVSSGIINISNINVAKTINLKASSGIITANNVDGILINGSVNSGLITFKDVNMADNINLLASSGSITATNTNSLSISAKASSGLINLGNVYAYNVATQTTSGLATVVMNQAILMADTFIQLNHGSGRSRLNGQNVSGIVSNPPNAQFSIKMSVNSGSNNLTIG